MKTLLVLMISCYSIWSPKNAINPERTELLNEVFQLLEDHVANPAWLETASFKAFKQELYSDRVMKMNDEEFLEFFRSNRHSIGFSHFDLHSKAFVKKIEQDTKGTPIMYWKALDTDVAYLNVNTFVTDGAPMAKILSEIGTTKYNHLIIDLRNNGGGSLDAPVLLGRFLTQEPIDAGVYLTRKWFLKHKRPATSEDITTMPFLQDFTYKGIGKMYKEEEAFRMVLPAHNSPIFNGKVYVLVNENTGSACEPLIDLLKKEQLAVLIGSKSAGNMLTGNWFNVNEKYKAFIPISDYQTADGDRLDQKGVEPNYKIDPENALDFVITELINKTR